MFVILVVFTLLLYVVAYGFFNTLMSPWNIDAGMVNK